VLRAGFLTRAKKKNDAANSRSSSAGPATPNPGRQAAAGVDGSKDGTRPQPLGVVMKNDDYRYKRGARGFGPCWVPLLLCLLTSPSANATLGSQAGIRHRDGYQPLP
jgi:hypothetical protein